MTIGLNKDEIIAKLNQNREMNSDALFENIANIIVENNKLIEQQVTNVVAKEITKMSRLY